MTRSKRFIIIIGLILGISLIGFADASYLTVQHYRGIDITCSITHGCDEVLTSEYATIAGVPIALGGALFYLTVLVLSIIYFDTRRNIIITLIAWLSIPGFVVTLGLVYLQAFVIEAWCQYCLVSAGTSTLIFILGVMLFVQLRQKQSEKITELVMATRNPGKVKEMKHILSDAPVQIISADEADIHGQAPEDQDTLKDNAVQKARHVAEQTNHWVVAEDTGLFIDALDGRPGVHSARHAGPGATDEQRRDKVLQEMQEVPDDQRAARFISVLAVISPQGKEHIFRGTAEGSITREPLGALRPHLPYDQIFLYDKKTFAQMTDTEKNAISQRRVVFEQLKDFIRSHGQHGTK